MADLKYIQSQTARLEWAKMPILLQMGNIGSEVSRALKWQAKGRSDRMNTAIDRALELFDWTIAAQQHASILREILLAREEFCQYFFDGQDFQVDPEKMLNYYNGFVMMSRNV